MRASVLFAVVVAAGCSGSNPAEPDAGGTNIFVGELQTLNGQPTSGSQLQIRLFSEKGNFAAPDRYRITGGCFDAGFLDKADGRFWSGSAPAKNGDLPVATPAARGAGHCPPEDAARYVQLIEIMYEGPKLDFDQASATFTAPTKGSAEFQLGPVYPD